MQIKPVAAVIVVVSLLVLGSAVGAYLALLASRVEQAPVATVGTPPAASPLPNESTAAHERQLAPTAVRPPDPSPPAAAPRPAAVPAPPPPARAQGAGPPPVAPPSPVQDSTRPADVEPPRPAVVDPMPPAIALAAIDPATLGAVLAPETRPVVRRELVLAADTVIGLQVDTPVTSEYALVEDDVAARVTRDVVMDDTVVVPAGSLVRGSVVLVEPAARFRGSSRLGVRFHTVVLDPGREIPIATETVYRMGKGRGAESAAKIGGAALGSTILGAIFGGRRGAAIGGATGAASGTAAAMAGKGEPATLPTGTTLTIRLSQPATVIVEG